MEKVKTMFENRYKTGMEVLEEFVENVVVLRYRSWKALVGLLAMLAVIVAFSVMAGGDISVLNIILAWLAICFIYLVIYPYRENKKIIKRSKENFTNYVEGENVTWFDENYVTVSDGKDRSVFRYSQFKKLVETQNLYCLMIDGSKGVILRKDSFTLGSFESFKAFIEKITHKKTIIRK